MALEITARGKILLSESGKQYLHIDNPDWWSGELARFAPDTAVVVTIKKWYKKRSLKQNSVLHWYINAISDETGQSVDTIKEVLRHKFLSEDIVDRNGEIMADRSSGEVLKRYKSTTELSTMQFNEFTENIRLWANDFLGLQLPLPNEAVELKFDK